MGTEYYYTCPVCGKEESVVAIATSEVGDIIIDVYAEGCDCRLTHDDTYEIECLTYDEYVQDMMVAAELAGDLEADRKMHEAFDEGGA